MMVARDLFVARLRYCPVGEVRALAAGDDVVAWLEARKFIVRARRRRSSVPSSAVADCDRPCRMEIESLDGEVWAICPDGRCSMVRLTPGDYEQYEIAPTTFYAALADANGLLPPDALGELPAGIDAIGVFEDGGVRAAIVWVCPDGKPGRPDAQALIARAAEDPRTRVRANAVVGLASPAHAVAPERPDRFALAVFDAATVIDAATLALDRRRLHWAARGGRDEGSWFYDHPEIVLHIRLEEGRVVGDWCGVPLEAPWLNEHEEACAVYLLYLAVARQSDHFGWVGKRTMQWSDKGTDQGRLRDFVADLEARRVALVGAERIAAERLLPTASVDVDGGDSIRLAILPEHIHVAFDDARPRLATRARTRKANPKRQDAVARRADNLERLVGIVRDRLSAAVGGGQGIGARTRRPEDA